MERTIHYDACPICHSRSIRTVLTAEDFTVSHEKFVIVECADCSLRFTQDVPTEEFIGPYYKSEDYISHTNTSKGLINSLYQFVRKRTIHRKRRLVQRGTGRGKGNILDFGAGTGTFVSEMNQHGWEALGLEPDATARGVARDSFHQELLPAEVIHSLEDDRFHAITLWHVLEHVHALHETLDRFSRLLKEDGVLFIAVPNYTSLDAIIYGHNWAAYDVPRHLYHFSPSSMEKLMDMHGFSVTAKKPMWYDSFYISMLSSRYKNGKTKMIPALWTGMRSNLRAMIDREACSSLIYVAKKRK